MKKRTKISLRTKIYLTIVGLLAMAGIIYAATPFQFSTFPGLTGVAVSKTDLFTTGYAPPIQTSIRSTASGCKRRTRRPWPRKNTLL